jgi:hypothetical protein
MCATAADGIDDLRVTALLGGEIMRADILRWMTYVGLVAPPGVAKGHNSP